MNKRIILSLLITTTIVLHGTKRKNNNEIFIFNHDVMPMITEGICLYHSYKPDVIKNEIRTLSYTCKFFHDYYEQETVKQNIIRLCSHHLNSNDKDVAYKLKCYGVLEKIEYFTNVALKKKTQFTTEDLKQEWYLNIRTTFLSKFLQRYLQQSLLQITINHSQLKKVNDILDNVKELNFRYNREENILFNIAEERARIQEALFIDHQRLTDLLSIARKLLEKKILVDGRIGDTQRTPLMYAVGKQDRPFVYLLLEYDADPYAHYYNTYEHYYNTHNKKTQNAFSMEQEKGWLQTIIDEITTKKS